MTTTTAASSLVALPREAMGPLMHLIPDTPWTTTPLHALQARKAQVFVDTPAQPKNVVVVVKGPDDPGERDQAFLFGDAGHDGLRAYVAGIERATELVCDDDLATMVHTIHPDATPREAMCVWFEKLLAPDTSDARVPARRLRPTDIESLVRLVPSWMFRGFGSPAQMVSAGACIGVELNGELVSVAYVVDQSVKYARISVFTAEAHRKKGYGVAAAKRLIQYTIDDGRLPCGFAGRRSAPAVRLALRASFPGRALLRSYVAAPAAAPPLLSGAEESTSSSAQTQG